MAKRSDEDALVALGEAILRTLEAQRDLGGDAHPPTLRRLAELSGGVHSDEQVTKAAAKKAFTARAVVTEKVDKKPSLESPVYLKEDVPKKPATRRAPAAKKDDGAAVLTERMLLVLEAQRRLGDGAYPPTLRRLAELCEVNASDSRVAKAAGDNALADRAVVAAKSGNKPSLDAPVLLKEDVEGGAPALLPALLRFALSPAPTKGKTETNAFPPAELTKRLVPALRGPFGDLLERRIERQDLPPEVAWVAIKGKPHLFLVENLRPRGRRQPTPHVGEATPPPPVSNGAPSAPPGGFAEAFREAFDRIDRRNGSTNFVKLADLRRALPGFGRDEFDAELRRLRLEGQFSLDSHEGLHGSLSPEERDAGVREAGSLLVYVSRR